MHLRFAQVAPPSGDTLGSESLQTVPEPFPRIGIAHVKHSGVSHPCGDVVCAAGRVACQHFLLCKEIIIVDCTLFIDIRLMDKHKVYPLTFQRIDHALMVRPLLLIPFKPPHVGLHTIPVEVEHHAVYRITAGL